MPGIEKLLNKIGEGGLFRTSDLEALGMSRSTVGKTGVKPCFLQTNEWKYRVRSQSFLKEQPEVESVSIELRSLRACCYSGLSN